jgi:NADP-dependent 3-hydroxy acid dehydrogenase YdfG
MSEVPATDADSVAAMQKRGLKVIWLDRRRAQFERAAEQLMRACATPSSADVYDPAVKERRVRQSRPR